MKELRIKAEGKVYCFNEEQIDEIIQLIVGFLYNPDLHICVISISPDTKPADKIFVC